MAKDADELLDDENKAEELLKSKKAQLKENQREKDLKRLKSVRSLPGGQDDNFIYS